MMSEEKNNSEGKDETLTKVDDKDRDKLLKEFRSWIESEEKFPRNVPDAFVQRYLKVCDYDLKSAKELITLNYKLRTSQPNLFTNRDILTTEMQNASSVMKFFCLPNLTKDKYKITIGGMLNPDLSKFHYPDIVKIALMLFDTRYSDFDDDNEIAEGEIIIADMKSMSFRMFFKMLSHLPTAMFYTKYLQDSLPQKIIQMNIINPSSVVDRMFSLMRPIMKKELLDVIHIHNDLESLQKRVGKENLPKELGGDVDIDLMDVQSYWVKKMEEKRDFLMNDDNWRFSK